MQYYDVDKFFSFTSQRNVDVVKQYIKEHSKGHRVFLGNFENFNAVQLLNMLGFNIRLSLNQDGKYLPRALQLHAYEEDAPYLISLLNGLE